MTVLTVNDNGGFEKYDIPQLCPEGTYSAICVDLMERFGVEEPSYNDPSVMVTKDKCRPLFAVNVNGVNHLVQTYEFNISGSPKSKLLQFIKAWIGKAPPRGFDTPDLIGQTCTINISHETSKKGSVYASINSIIQCTDPASAPKLEDVEIPGGRRTELPVAAGASEKGADENPF